MAKLIANGLESRIATETFVHEEIGKIPVVDITYADLPDKPMINNVIVDGERTGSDFGLAGLATNTINGTLLDLQDVYNTLLDSVTALQTLISNGDESVLQTITQILTTSYRSSQAQDAVDDTKVAKLDFTDSTANPNGFVLLWMQPNFAADAVSIDYAGMQPVTGTFAPGTVALPFANINAAGIMAKEDKQTLDNLTERMTAVEQGLSTERFVNTKADLLAVDTTDMPVWTPYIVRTDSDYDNATTKYYYNPEGESPTTNGFVFGFVAQEVPYTVATATTLGLTLSSTVAGKVQYEGTGVGSVNGWDALVARVTDLETWKTQQQNFNTTHNHSGGSQGIVLPMPFTTYADDATAQADMTGKQALSPIQ